jgi:hypothetical protein
LLIKKTNAAAAWKIVDNMRGFTAGPESTGIYSSVLNPNTSDAEAANSTLYTTSTGFNVGNYSSEGGAGNTFIYIAIRRGPMKVPTTGTSVFDPELSAAATGNTVTTNFPVDLQIAGCRTISLAANFGFSDRLRGVSSTSTEIGAFVASTSTAAEVTGLSAFRTLAWNNTGYNQDGYLSGSGFGVYWNFRRAPGFFDEVCWTGNGTGAARNHNLTVYPELVISKLRNGGAGFGAWGVQNNINPSAKQTGVLNTTAAFSSSGATSPTATVFYPSDDQSGANYVTYLFASAPGVSKVGSYTGTGATQTIDCGFTAGSRFVLIKATSTTGDWYVWDSARGIVAGNDPYLRPNSTAVEVTGTDWVDTAATGFELSNAGGNLANSNGVSYIFLAIA